jgi:hypothetical protein
MEWKADRRRLAGRPPSMMIAAQVASLIEGGFVLPLPDESDEGPGDGDWEAVSAAEGEGSALASGSSFGQ